MNENIIEHAFHLKREDKEKRNGHKGAVLWLCGLSGSGKSTIANLLEQGLFEKGLQVAVLDGDSVRHGLCQDLGFSQEDRRENLRRVAQTAKLFANNSLITVCCFITPLKKHRELLQEILQEDLHLVYVKADLALCEGRDPKGLYKKARAGKIKDFTGISSQFEEPANPHLLLDTKKSSAQEAAALALDYVQEKFI